jgi:hypothetical protein
LELFDILFEREAETRGRILEDEFKRDFLEGETEKGVVEMAVLLHGFGDRFDWFFL